MEHVSTITGREHLAQEQVQNALRRAAIKPRLDSYCMIKHVLVPAGCFASIRRESCENRLVWSLVL